MDPKTKPTTAEQIEARELERERYRQVELQRRHEQDHLRDREEQRRHEQDQLRDREQQRTHDAELAERDMIVKIVALVAVGIVAFTSVLSFNTTRSNRTAAELGTERVITCLEQGNDPLECSLVSQLHSGTRN